MSAGPVFLYLHGFASSPQSTKARAFEAWGARRGIPIRSLDLRVPSFADLRFSAMKSAVRQAIGGPRDRAVLVGSSLGGLTAARVAEEDPRVAAVFLMAPAFGLADLWKRRLGPDGWARWRDEGSIEVDDHAADVKGGRSRVGWGFGEELDRLEGGERPDVRVPTCVVHGVRDEVVPVEGQPRALLAPEVAAKQA